MTEQDVTLPTSDGIHLKLVTVARSGSSFHPTIDGFKGGLSLKDQEPFIYINVPKTKADAKVDIVVDQDVTLNSKDQFNSYNKVVMGSETFDVYLKGKTKMHLSGLSGISVDYSKKVTMKGKDFFALYNSLHSKDILTLIPGLNKLSGLNITEIKILSGTTGSNAILADGSNMVGNVSIPNPSVMTLDLGNVTMNLAVDGTAIGYSVLPNLVLKPGTNLVPMQANVQQIAVISVIQSKYKDGVIPLDISGNSSVSNGQHLEYFEEAIKSNTVRVNLNTKPALEAIGLGSVFNATSS